MTEDPSTPNPPHSIKSIVSFLATAVVIVLAVVIATALFITHFTSFNYQSPASPVRRHFDNLARGALFVRNGTRWYPEPRPRKPKSPKVCLIYDKSPHTGSTTIATAMSHCWTKELQMPHLKYRPQFRAIPQSLLTGTEFMAASRNHIYFDDNHTIELYHTCEHLFLVTSTRDIIEKVFSGILHRSTLKGTGKNYTLDESKTGAAWNEFWTWFDAQTSQNNSVPESSHQFYPFIAEVRIESDYVIRHEHLTDDLANLLDAFGCQTKFTTTNVHNTSDVDDDFDEYTGRSMNLDEYKGIVDDPRHDYLNKRAVEHNQIGILKAKSILRMWEESKLESV